MKLKLLTMTAILAGTICNTTGAFAEHAAYVSGALGWRHTQDARTFDALVLPFPVQTEYEEAFNATLALGTHFHPNMRGEVEIGYRAADIDSIAGAALRGELKTWTGMLNGYYDFTPDNAWSPYITAGLGLANHNATVSAGGVANSDEDAVFAWQVGLGATYDLNENTALTSGYRYLSSLEMEIGTTEVEYAAHEINVGLIWYLN